MIGPGSHTGRILRLLGRLREEQRGLTVVEGVVAAMLLVVGALGVLQVFDASTRNNFRAEESQVVNNRLQAELERIRQLPFAEVALTDYPAGSADPNDPRSRVAGTQFAVDRSGGTSQQPLVVAGAPIPDGGTVEGGSVQPGPEPFSTGDISGTIYRFITWAPVPDCPDCGEAAMKRVVVAAKVDEAPVSFERSFQEVHTDIPDPDVSPDPNPGPPGEEQDGYAANFWLTDTTCDNDERQPITASHPTHNTRGRCANGHRTGSTRGAPDLMFTEGPAIDPDLPPEGQPLFDYSTDVSGSADGHGLTMPWSSTDSCMLEPVLSILDIRKLLDGLLDPLPSEPGPLDGVLDLTGGESNKHLRVHTWLSPKVTGDGGVLAGKGNLDLWTRTVNGTSHPGEICVWLFRRQTVQVPVKLLLIPLYYVDLEVDVPFVNVGMLTNNNGLTCQQGLNLTYFRCSQNPWPSGWSKISVPMDFVNVDSSGEAIPAVLPPQSRLGLSLMVRKGGTEPGQGLEFMYDHVDFESRLQVRTDAQICFGNC